MSLSEKLLVLQTMFTYVDDLYKFRSSSYFQLYFSYQMRLKQFV